MYVQILQEVTKAFTFNGMNTYKGFLFVFIWWPVSSCIRVFESQCLHCGCISHPHTHVPESVGGALWITHMFLSQQVELCGSDLWFGCTSLFVLFRFMYTWACLSDYDSKFDVPRVSNLYYLEPIVTLSSRDVVSHVCKFPLASLKTALKGGIPISLLNQVCSTYYSLICN